MRFLVTTIVAALAAGTLAAPLSAVPDTHALHEKRHEYQARKWIKRDRLDAGAVLPMRVGMTQSNLDKGYDLLMDVSDPESPNYAKHYTFDQIAGIFAPSEESAETVRAWLIEHGISEDRIRHSDDKGWFAFDATATEAESLLHTTYHEYEHIGSGYKTASCEEYHVPKHVQRHIDYITPGVKLFAPAENRRNKAARRAVGDVVGRSLAQPPTINAVPPPQANVNDTSTCDQAITPACIRALYGIPENNMAHSSNALGIFEEGDYYAQEDLDMFFANYTPGIPKGTHPTPAFIDGATAPVGPTSEGGESDLDFELAYPLIWPQKITLYQTDDVYNAGGQKLGLFNTFLDGVDGSYCTYSAFGETGDDPVYDAVYPDTADASGYKGKTQCGVYAPTNVISISYGRQEADLPYYYQQRQCNEFMKLGMAGHSILFASGDSGVAGRLTETDPSGCIGSQHNVFNPGWPASCPYVTSVGATKVYPGKTVKDPESAVNDPAGHPYGEAYSSGGGFSNIYSVPGYQKSAVATYFADHDPGYKYYSALHNATHNDSAPIGAGGGVYNRIGRGLPDVAANGDNIAIYNHGSYGLSGGTSASTPIFASVINLINENRLAAGKAPVGFLNPTLYANPGILNDITNGSNPACNTSGFSAVKGWDPVTGLGTPNYPKMLAKFMSLP